MSPLKSPLTPFVDPLPLPMRILAGERDGHLSIRVRAATHRFHRDLPTSRVWAYEGSVPGPTIEAERGRPVRVEWLNELEGTLPVAVTIAPAETDDSGVPVQCLPGLSGGVADPDAAALPGYTVTHLHGGVTPAAYDGWTENISAPGQQAVSDYPMDQRAALLWYHDHVMGVTRFTVYAGLAGLWIVRDQRERDLDLPEGPPFGCRCCSRTATSGKARTGGLPASSCTRQTPRRWRPSRPFTTVNGKVWPVLDVQPTTYRLRLINGSNARTFRLVLLRDRRPQLDRITQIGTDGGLLQTRVAIPPQGLVLASAQRADLLVDFSDLEPGSELTLLNTARAPFDGSSFPAESASEAADIDGLLPYPEVMRFGVVPGRSVRRRPPEWLASDLGPPSAHELAAALHRAVALAEQELDHRPNVLTMRELAAAPDRDGSEPLITVIDREAGTGAETVTRFRTVAAHFEDTVTFFPTLGQWEVWQLINLTGDTHPIHVHLNPFYILARRPITVTVPEGGIGDRETTATVRLWQDPDDELEHTIDANERGLHDTVRVNPKEIVEIAVRFETFSGRYMYHCHILEHEDRDMMRPIVVMPPALMPFMS